MVLHWLGLSQRQLSAKADYKKLQALLSEVARERRNPLTQRYDELKKQQRTLRRDYHELVEEYKSPRRYFSVSAAVPYTDVWTHKPVQFYPGKHPCEKPADMLRQIINASSRSGNVAADFFMGSGSTIKATIALGRRGIGVELDSERFEQAAKEINAEILFFAMDIDNYRKIISIIVLV